MPAESKAQRAVMAIAEHHPSELYSRNRGVLDMTHGQLHDFAATKETHLPEHKMSKHRKHNVRHTEIRHHDDGTHTITHHRDDGSESSHAVPDLDVVKANLEQNLGPDADGDNDGD